jgi:cytochrome c-type biogenesis protein CcmE
MKTYLKFGGIMAVIVGSLFYLAMSGVADTKTYYKTIPELQKMGKAAQDHKLRVGGDVQPGSIMKKDAGTTFVLHQGAVALNVVYTGSDPLPDTFRDNAQALADGSLGSDGVFHAKKIQAKCASKYEAKPNQKGVSHAAQLPDKISSLR